MDRWIAMVLMWKSLAVGIGSTESYEIVQIQRELHRHLAKARSTAQPQTAGTIQTWSERDACSMVTASDWSLPCLPPERYIGPETDDTSEVRTEQQQRSILSRTPGWSRSHVQEYDPSAPRLGNPPLLWNKYFFLILRSGSEEVLLLKMRSIYSQ